MSKENKVNPGQYTQAGRLTQDETAREMKKQRSTASPRNTEGGPFPDKTKARRVTQKDKANEDENDE